MVTVNRKQTLMWELNPTVFEVLNKDVLFAVTRPLGTGVSAVNSMLAQSDEMKAYMPPIVGSSPDNTAVDWQGVIEKYWHNFHIDVSETGYEMNTSFQVMGHGKYRKAIEAWYKENNQKIPESESAIEKDFAERLLDTTNAGVRVIPEQELYLYGMPVNVEEYLAWRYCLLSSQVANKPEDVDKSSKIRFYLHDEEGANRKKAEETKLFSTALKKYTDMMASGADKTAWANILLVYGNVPLADLTKLTLEDCQLKVGRMPYEKPKVFIEAVEDTNIVDKARILRYIDVGLLRKLDNSSAIVDATTLNSIGSNLIDAVIYFKDKTNEPYAAELKAKYAALKK